MGQKCPSSKHFDNIGSWTFSVTIESFFSSKIRKEFTLFKEKYLPHVSKESVLLIRIIVPTTLGKYLIIWVVFVKWIDIPNRIMIYFINALNFSKEKKVTHRTETLDRKSISYYLWKKFYDYYFISLLTFCSMDVW